MDGMTNNPAKIIIAIAGPNGADKTTLAMELLPNEAERRSVVSRLESVGLPPCHGLPRLRSPGLAPASHRIVLQQDIAHHRHHRHVSRLRALT